MPKQIDHDRICTMIRTGVSVRLVAKRLRCSEKTVRRVLAERRLTERPIGLVGTEHEWRLWEVWKSMGETATQIAYRFGFSRQHIHNHFSQPRQVDYT